MGGQSGSQGEGGAAGGQAINQLQSSVSHWICFNCDKRVMRMHIVIVLTNDIFCVAITHTGHDKHYIVEMNLNIPILFSLF